MHSYMGIMRFISTTTNPVWKYDPCLDTQFGVLNILIDMLENPINSLELGFKMKD